MHCAGAREYLSLFCVGIANDWNAKSRGRNATGAVARIPVDMDSRDSTNYLLLEIFALRERGERCRQRSQWLLDTLSRNTALLSHTRRRFQLNRSATTPTPRRDSNIFRLLDPSLSR
jgi:hypothetical protein